MKCTGLTLIVTLLFTPLTLFAQDMSGHRQHNQENEAQQLTEPGHDMFGTIQEVIRKLEEDPETDWSEVNLEPLRKHLLDMRDITEHVQVLVQKPIEKGIQIKIQPTRKRAKSALNRVLNAHPDQLKKETGWRMNVTKKEATYLLEVTTSQSHEISKIRGLGYIGIMAYGKHHQQHHWKLATGQHPHHK